MSRFRFTSKAEQDFEEIAAYLDGLPSAPATRIAKQLQEMLVLLGQRPKLGHFHDEYSLLRGDPVRSFTRKSDVCYYVDQSVPVLLGLLHGRQDIDSIMRQRPH